MRPIHWEAKALIFPFDIIDWFRNSDMYRKLNKHLFIGTFSIQRKIKRILTYLFDNGRGWFVFLLFSTLLSLSLFFLYSFGLIISPPPWLAKKFRVARNEFCRLIILISFLLPSELEDSEFSSSSFVLSLLMGLSPFLNDSGAPELSWLRSKGS